MGVHDVSRWLFSLRGLLSLRSLPSVRWLPALLQRRRSLRCGLFSGRACCVCTTRLLWLLLLCRPVAARLCRGPLLSCPRQQVKHTKHSGGTLWRRTADEFMAGVPHFRQPSLNGSRYRWALVIGCSMCNGSNDPHTCRATPVTPHTQYVMLLTSLYCMVCIFTEEYLNLYFTKVASVSEKR